MPPEARGALPSLDEPSVVNAPTEEATLPTIGDKLSYVGSVLTDVTDEAGLEARRLLQAAAGLTWTQIIAGPNRRLAAATVERLNAMIAQRLAGEPLAYILGEVEFDGLRLIVDKRALIPRPETELMVELVRRIYQAAGARPGLAIDVGTGSGCLAMALAHSYPDCLVVASDSSLDALMVANRNRTRLSMPNLCLVAADCLQPFAGRFDLVVANLPYVPSGRLAQLQTEVREHEPVVALNGGPDGLALYRRLFADLPSVLADDGIVVCELDETNAEVGRPLLKARLPGRPAFLLRDQFGKKRFLVVAPIEAARQVARGLRIDLIEI